MTPLAALRCSAPGDEGEALEDETAEAPYTASGTCDGLPKLNLQTPPGVCVGIVAEGITFARGLTQLDDGDVIVAGMGGWAVDKGIIWRLSKNGAVYSKRQLLTLIDKPSGIHVNPKDKLVYVGTPGDIFRFDPNQLPKPRLTQVLKELPAENPNGARHPLKHFTFDVQNPDVIYVNSGSASDNCEKDGQFPRNCWEEAINRGSIRKYVMTGPERKAAGYTVHARGLRNSMALTMHPTSGLLLQGENARDSINKRAPELTSREAELPQEEINIVEAGQHYGWPYCYANGVAAPEYRSTDCSGYKNPALLLPGHSSPLGMRFYNGAMFPEASYKGNLLVTLHGYRESGHRLVLVPTDARGVPAGEPLDIIRGWEKTPQNPLGAPVDVMVAKDGSIWLTEDKNGTVLRVFYDRTRGDGKPLKTLPPVRPVVSPEETARCNALAGRNNGFSAVQKHVIDPSCTSCHGVGPGYAGGLALLKCDDIGNAKRLLAARRNNTPPYVLPRNVAGSEFVQRMKGNGFPQMPAGGVNPEGLAEVESWINAGAPVPQ